MRNEENTSKCNLINQNNHANKNVAAVNSNS